MRLRNRWLLAAAMLLAAGRAGVASATPLGLVLLDHPDILAQFVDVKFVAAGGAFSASGAALELAVAPGTVLTLLDARLDIDVVTDGMAVSGVAGDDLSIVGGVDTNGDGTADIAGTLMTGEVSAFGATASGPGVFELLFEVSGGLLADTGRPFDVPAVGVILSADGNSTYAGSFDVDFDNNGGVAGAGTGSADVAPIPEPGTLLLLGSGFAGLLGFRRRGRRIARSRPRALRCATIALGVLAGLALAAPSSATLLGNPLQFPLLSFDSGGSTSYDAASAILSVDALPIAFRLAVATPPRPVTPNPPAAGELVTIDVVVDAAGNLVGGVAGDDLTVLGFIDLDGNGTLDVGGTLLTGEVIGFGFQDNAATDLYDFAFTVTGGALAPLFDRIVGVSMQSESSTFAGTFSDDFEGEAKGTIGVIPEPATMLLVCAGVAGLALAGRRRLV